MKLLNSNTFELPGTSGWYHLASVQENLREFMCFSNSRNGKIYIEEITGGTGPDWISDESLVKEIYDFLVEKGILRLGKLN